MKTKNIMKEVELADGRSVWVHLDSQGRVETIDFEEEDFKDLAADAPPQADGMSATLILRLADLINREERNARTVCADHGEYELDRGSYRCPSCKADEEAARAAELAQAAA